MKRLEHRPKARHCGRMHTSPSPQRQQGRPPASSDCPAQLRTAKRCDHHANKTRSQPARTDACMSVPAGCATVLSEHSQEDTGRPHVGSTALSYNRICPDSNGRHKSTCPPPWQESKNLYRLLVQVCRFCMRSLLARQQRVVVVLRMHRKAQ